MRIESPRNISTYLLILGLIVFLIGVLMLMLSYRASKNLEFDATIINQTGIVRGSIQRLTKLELSGCPDPPCDQLVHKIDSLLVELLESGTRFRSGEEDRPFVDSLRHLNQEWERLKHLVFELRHSQDTRLHRVIIEQSELCWKLADTAVLSAQITAESKVQNIRTITYLVAASICNTLLIIWLIFQFVRKKLEYRAAFDGMTGLLNKASYQTTIEREFARCLRYQRQLALILFDVDHFKKVNDTYGHRTGDRTLTQMAALVKSSVRQSDWVFRVGGEEFAIVSPETGLEAARQLAEKIREEIAQHSFQQVGEVTISLGIAEATACHSPDDLFKHADNALYQAKANGRNRVEPRVE